MMTPTGHQAKEVQQVQAPQAAAQRQKFPIAQLDGSQEQLVSLLGPGLTKLLNLSRGICSVIITQVFSGARTVCILAQPDLLHQNFDSKADCIQSVSFQ